MEVLGESNVIGGFLELIPKLADRLKYRRFGIDMSIWDYELVTGRPQPDVAMPDLGIMEIDTVFNKAPIDSELQVCNAFWPCSTRLTKRFKAPPEALTKDALVQWVKLFVDQFVAQQDLQSLYRARPNISIELSLLAVGPIRYRVPSWDNFRETIKNALMKTTYPPLLIRVPDLLQCLEEKIAGFKVCSTATETKATVEIFRAIVKGEEQDFSVGPHCVAVLVALVKFSPTSDDIELAQICEVHNRTLFLAK